MLDVNFVIGVCISLTASFLSALGLFLQRKFHEQSSPHQLLRLHPDTDDTGDSGNVDTLGQSLYVTITPTTTSTPLQDPCSIFPESSSDIPRTPIFVNGDNYHSSNQDPNFVDLSDHVWDLKHLHENPHRYPSNESITAVGYQPKDLHTLPNLNPPPFAVDTTVTQPIKTPPCASPLWLSGIGLYVGSQVLGSTFALSYISPILLAPLGAATLVFNALLARCLGHEKLTSHSIVGTCLLLVGTVLIALYGFLPETGHSLDDMLILFQRPVFLFYLGSVDAVVLIMGICVKILSWKRSHGVLNAATASAADSVRSRATLPCSPLPSYACDGSYQSSFPQPRGEEEEEEEVESVHHRTGIWKSQESLSVMIGALSAAVGGTMASQTLLFAKCGIELLLTTLARGENQFQSFLSLFILVGLISTGALQIVYLNFALSICDTLLVVPLFYCLYNVFSLLNGLVFFDQLSHYQTHSLVIILVGVFVDAVGVYVLSRASSEELELDTQPNSAGVVHTQGVPSAAAGSSSLETAKFWKSLSNVCQKLRSVIPRCPSFADRKWKQAGYQKVPTADDECIVHPLASTKIPLPDSKNQLLFSKESLHMFPSSPSSSFFTPASPKR